MNIPEEAVEAAAKAMAQLGEADNGENQFADFARAALDAAAPHLVTEHFRVKHTKADPACIYYKETGTFRRYLNERGRGKACLVCVPKWKARK
jgi:hypothetical protein